MKRNVFMSFENYISSLPIFQSFGHTLKLAFVGMEEIVSGSEFDLVVQGVGCRETVENAAIGYIYIDEC